MTEKLQKLLNHFSSLPSIGPRHAMRIILAMLDWEDESLKDFGENIESLKNTHVLCSQCYNFSDNGLCSICLNGKRNRSRIAVVEKVTDLATMEKASVFDGIYHVLGGAINPVAGVLPDKLKIRELIERLKESPAGTEVIIATNPNSLGETTALYLEQELASLGNDIKITRLARGLASGTTLEYADESTLANALKNRK